MTGIQGRGRTAPLASGLVSALVLAACVLAACSAPAAAVFGGFPSCGDVGGAMVIEEPPDADRVVTAYNATGERLWRASLGRDAFPVPVGHCAVAVLSSSVRAWPHPDQADPLTSVSSREGTTVWPGQVGFTKYRVLAATAVGDGVVAVGRGANISVLLQAGGEYVHTMEMASADVDWAQSPDRSVGVAYEYLNPGGHLVFYALDGQRWRFVRRVEVPGSLVHAAVVSPDRYLVRTENEFLLYSAGRKIFVAPTDFYSDAYLSDRYVVLVSRRIEGDGRVRNDVQVLDDRLRPVYTKRFADIVLVSSGPGSGVVLSAPGRATVVDGAGSHPLAAEPGQYVLAGADGTLAFVGPGRVRTRPPG